MSSLNRILNPILEQYVSPGERFGIREWIVSQFNLELRRSPRITVLGNTGVGKTSTINALFGTNLPVGHVDPTTRVPRPIPIHGELVQGLNGSIVVYDMPGVNDDEDIEEHYIESYKKAIKKSDVAVWIVQAPTRGLRYDQMILSEILPYNPAIYERLVIGINQVDLVHPNNWNRRANLPSRKQHRNIRGKEQRVFRTLSKICPDLTEDRVVSYSAEKHYRLDDLFGAMMEACVKQRAWVLLNRVALPDIEEFIDPEYLR